MSGAVVTIGNFDGCHVGHQSLLAKAFEISKSYQATPLVYTFDPHPQEFFSGLYLPRLFNRHQKTQAFRELGVSQVVTQSFDQAFSEVCHQDFYQKCLLAQLKAKAVVVGEDFRFGHKRLGDVTYLRMQAKKDGLIIEALPALTIDGMVVSSSRIRTVLSDEGDVSLAIKMLGRPYVLQGEIVKGQQLGRTLGFPTANLSHIQQLVPRSGVYIGYAHLGPCAHVMNMRSKLIPMVTNIGYRPTVSQTRELSVESHFLAGQYEELYGQKLSLYFVKRLRDEKAFADKSELVAQITIDAEQAKKELTKI